LDRACYVGGLFVVELGGVDLDNKVAHVDPPAPMRSTEMPNRNRSKDQRLNSAM
jgi:hypothetical protein